MSKHSSSDVSNLETIEPRAKRRKQVEFEPVRICSVSGVKDIDNKVLKSQHYKLCERYRYNERLRLALEKRVEELEGRQTKDDEVTCIINRYWNRLDEDVQLLLQRFDADATLSLESKDEKENSVKHFLNVLSNWSLEEVDEKLSQRVEFTWRALSKLVNVFDKVTQRHTSLISLINGETGDTLPTNRSSSPTCVDENPLIENNGPPKSPLKKEQIDEEIKLYAKNILLENIRLQNLVTFLEAENHRISIKSASYDDHISILENHNETISTKLEDVRYELDKSWIREEKLDYRLAEYVRKEQTLEVQTTTVKNEDSDKKSNGVETDDMANVSKTKLAELQEELDIQTELASTRLIELQEMSERNKTITFELETCQMNLKYIQPEVIKMSPEYLCIQSNLSAIFEDCRALKHDADDLKNQLAQQKEYYANQIEQMKVEEKIAQDRMQETVMELDNQLNSMTKEYETICIEVEQNTAVHQQQGPIKEQENILMNTYISLNAQLKQELNRCKKRLSEVVFELEKAQKELELDESKRKSHKAEDHIARLRKELANAKQVEDALSAEMESTGQAFEEMQEQNNKLIQQLREKDEVNLKLMAERIRTNHAQKKMKDEKEVADSYMIAQDNQLAVKTLLLQKLGEKERALIESRITLEHELKLRDQANEMLKRKAAESSQSANDLKLRLDKLTSQFNEVQEIVCKKSALHEVSSMKIKRLEEEKSSLKRKYERAKRMEKFENIDELIKEENRLYKETLTCPSCKVHPKNAILTKCWHVFCFDCLKLRYDTRRRKCPKCNAGFGANDFRRIYIE